MRNLLTLSFAAQAWVHGALTGLSVYLIVALIVIIILYWCDMYVRVFSTESHPRVRAVAKLYKWLLAVFLVVEISCRLVYSRVESARAVLIIHSLFVAACCAVTAGGFLYFGRRHYKVCFRFLFLNRK